MVKILGKDVFVDDYGITVNLETDLGLITFFTNFPRRNKWIGRRMICMLEIRPGVTVEHLETPDLHIRDIQTFTHRLLMKVEEVYPKNLVTRDVIDEYRRKHED
jgi:hypothetical protein